MNLDRSLVGAVVSCYARFKKNFSCKWVLGFTFLVLSGCTVSVSISSLVSARFTEVGPIIDSSNATDFAIKGQCNSKANFALQAQGQGQATLQKMADIQCSSQGTFAINSDFSSIPDGNVELSLYDLSTNKKVTQTTVIKDTTPPISSLLTPPPSTNNLTSIVSGISTLDTAQYSIKVTTAGSADCAIETGYSSYTPVATTLSENIAMLPDGPITLCLRGQDAVGNIQLTPTVYSWIKDTSVPTAILAGLPLTDTNVASQTGSVTGSSITHYKYKFGVTSLIDCADLNSYGAELPIATTFTITTPSANSYTVCALGRNSLGTWQAASIATSTSWNFDNVSPTLSITAPSAGAYVGTTNQTNYSISTSCSENTRSVTFNATSVVDGSTVFVTSVCAAGTATANINLSTLQEGNINLTTSQTDIAGNTGTSTAVSVLKDITAPTLGGSLTHASYTTSLTATPTLSWSAATDTGSGILKYQVALGTSLAGTETVAWTDVGNVTTYQITGLSLSNGTTYYPKVRAVDKAGQISSSLTSSGYLIDTTGPDVSAVILSLATDEWSQTASPVLSWNSAIDGGTGVNDYQVAIGSAAGLSDIKAWTSVGNTNSTTVTGLTLTQGTTYYASLRAVDVAGNVSTVVNGANGWLVNKELWVTSGIVNSIVKSDTRIYLGGYFSTIGPWTGSAVPVNLANGSVQWPNTANRARVNGSVESVISDGSGGFYIGGTFTKVGEINRSNLAHILADGSVDPAFNPTPDSTVLCLILSGTTLYIGGNFTSINGIARNYIGAVSTVDGSVAVTFDPNADSTVHTLALSGTTLYLGGDFTNVQGSAKGYLAAVSTIDGSLITGFTASAQSTVYCLLVNGTDLYVGGYFTHLNGTLRYGVGLLSASTGALVAGFNANLNVFATVTSMQLSGSTLYISGQISSVNGNARANVAAISATNGSIVAGFTANTNSVTYSLLVSGSTLYIGGIFTQVNGVSRYGIAAVSTTNGAVDATFNPKTNAVTHALALSVTNLYIAGNFNSVGVTDKNNLAAISTDGTLVSGFDPNPNSIVNSLVVSGSTLYVGGGFTSISGTSRNNLAAISKVDGTIVSGFSADTNGAVSTLAADTTHLYVGGTFTTIKGSSRNRLAAVALSDGTVVTGFDPNVNGTVSSMTLSSNSVYFGGNFSTVKGAAHNYIAAVLKSDGSLVAGFTPNVDNQVLAMTLSGSTLYIGGYFTSVGSGTQNNLGAISAVDGSPNTTFAPIIDSSPSSLLISGSYLYLAGPFSTISGTPQYGVAAVSKVDGSFNATFRPYISGYTSTLAVDGSYLYFAAPSSPVNINTGARIPASL